MTNLAFPSGAVPHAEPSPTSLPFWEGCRAGELRFQRCRSCGVAQFPPATVCRNCHKSTLEWEVSAGRGSIYSWTIVWRPAVPVFEVPYAVAIIDLDEGYRMLSNVVGCDDSEIRAGLRVRTEFRSPDGELVLPCFVPGEG